MGEFPSKNWLLAEENLRPVQQTNMQAAADHEVSTVIRTLTSLLNRLFFRATKTGSFQSHTHYERKTA